MALKFVIDELVQVPGPMRELYKPTGDGKFALDITDHPDAARVAEFRSKNVALMQEAAKYGGIDPDAARAALAKVAAGDADDVVKLKLDLAQEKSARAAAEAATVAMTHRTAVSAAFIAAGGRPEAVDFIVAKAPTDADKLVEWLADAAISKELSFTFQPSRGGGADPKPTRLAPTPNVRILRDPTPNQIGEAAADIKAGKVKIEYTT